MPVPNQEHENKLVKEFINWDGDEIDLSGRSEYKKVVIKNCPNVDYIALENCGLEELIIEDCPKLKHLQGYHNNLTELKLGDFPELEKIYVPFNRLEVLEIDNCPKLDTLYCNNNRLQRLSRLDQFPELKTLHCYKNADLKTLNCNNLTKLEEVFAQECSIVRTVMLYGCESLRKLDLAENRIEHLDISDCRNLGWFSCRDNHLQKIDVSENRQLYFLILYNNPFPPLDISQFSHLHEMVFLGLGMFFPDDDGRSRERFLKYYNYNRWYGSLEALKDMKILRWLCINGTDIDKGTEYLPKSIETIYCESFSNDGLFKNRKVKVIEEWWKARKEKENQEKDNNSSDEGYISDNNSSSNTNTYSWDTYTSDYSEPSNKHDYRHYTITHQDLKGNIVFDGWKNLKILNVGNNCLNGLAVRNCPKLEQLIYAHNDGKMEPVIDLASCPNLKKIDKESWWGKNKWREKDPSEEQKEQSKEAYNNKIKAYNIVRELLDRIDKGEDISLEEIIKLTGWINHDWLELELQRKLFDLVQAKQKDRYLPSGEISDEEYNKLPKETKKLYAFSQLDKLIKEADKAIKKGDYQELEQLLEKMSRYKYTEAYRVLKIEEIQRLKQTVEDYKKSVKKRYLIGGGSILLVIVCLVGLIATIYRRRRRMKRRKLNRFIKKRRQ